MLVFVTLETHERVENWNEAVRRWIWWSPTGSGLLANFAWIWTTDLFFQAMSKLLFLLAVSVQVCLAYVTCSNYDSCMTNSWECVSPFSSKYDCCCARYQCNAQGTPPGFFYDAFDPTTWARSRQFHLYSVNSFWWPGATYALRLDAATREHARFCATNARAWSFCAADFCAPFLPAGHVSSFYSCIMQCNANHPLNNEDLQFIARLMFGCKIFRWCWNKICCPPFTQNWKQRKTFCWIFCLPISSLLSHRHQFRLEVGLFNTMLLAVWDEYSVIHHCCQISFHQTKIPIPQCHYAPHA